MGASYWQCSHLSLCPHRRQCGSCSIARQAFRWNETAGLAGSAVTLSHSALEVQKETSQ